MVQDEIHFLPEKLYAVGINPYRTSLSPASVIDMCEDVQFGDQELGEKTLF